MQILIMQYFENYSLQFDNNEMIDNIISTNKNNKFGLFNYKTFLLPESSNKTYDLIFCVDCSGSMSEKCADRFTKMQHIIYTLSKMIQYFKEYGTTEDIFITIFTFHMNTSLLCDRIKIKNNEDMIIEKIKKMTPLSSTDIETALMRTKEYIFDLKTKYPENDITQLFMTDGEVTKGSDDSAVLLKNIDDSISNIFIGFGLNHDACLLNKISLNKKDSYYFIDKIENSGFIYGEILHDILNKCLHDISLQITNGVIYHYKENTWVTDLYIHNLVGDKEKSYHILSDDPNNCQIHLLDNKKNNLFTFTNDITNADLTQYVYRQKTLQLLFELRQFDEYYSQKNINISDYEDKFDKLNLYKNKLKLFMKEVKEYMYNNNLIENAFMQNICNDIYISYLTLGTKHGAMFISSRQYSQGNQRCYSVNKPVEKVKKPMKKSQDFLQDFSQDFLQDLDKNDLDFGLDNGLDNDLDNDLNTTPYVSQSATNLIRYVTQKKEMNNYFEEKEEEDKLFQTPCKPPKLMRSKNVPLK